MGPKALFESRLSFSFSGEDSCHRMLGLQRGWARSTPGQAAHKASHLPRACPQAAEVLSLTTLLTILENFGSKTF